jgi:hypothetical protein
LITFRNILCQLVGDTTNLDHRKSKDIDDLCWHSLF